MMALMGLPRDLSEERLHSLIKAFVLVKKRVTVNEVCDFINFNNFGLVVTFKEVETFLRNNLYKSYKRGRGCMRNCYGCSQDGRGAKVYFIQEK